MLVRASAGPLPGRSSLCHESEHDERRIGRQERDGWRTSTTQQAGWFPLSSCQGLLTRTFTTALQKYITITSILPRQEERREAEESERDVWEREWREEGSGAKRE